MEEPPMRKVFKLERPDLAFGQFVEIDGEKRDASWIPELEILVEESKDVYSSFATSRDKNDGPRPRDMHGKLLLFNSAPDRSHMLMVEKFYRDINSAEGLVLNYWRAEKGADVGSVYLLAPIGSQGMIFKAIAGFQIRNGKAAVCSDYADHYDPAAIGAILARHLPRIMGVTQIFVDKKVSPGTPQRPIVTLAYNVDDARSMIMDVPPPTSPPRYKL